MPRAHRYFLPGYLWHIIHRCHQKEFLLKFAKDRKRWLHWLFEARKRYGLCVEVCRHLQPYSFIGERYRLESFRHSRNIELQYDLYGVKLA